MFLREEGEVTNLRFSFTLEEKLWWIKGLGKAVVWPGQSAQLCRRMGDPERRLLFACVCEYGLDDPQR